MPKLRLFLPEADVSLIIDALHTLNNVPMLRDGDKQRCQYLAKELENPPAGSIVDEGQLAINDNCNILSPHNFALVGENKVYCTHCATVRNI